MGNKSKQGKRNQKIRGQRYVPPVIGISGFDTRTIPVELFERKAEPSPDKDQKLIRAFAAMATNAWRAKRKILDVETGEPRTDELKRIYRHIEAIIDALGDCGITIEDFDKRRYDTGMAVNVVSAEDRIGCKREEIIETVKPTVRKDGTMIQRADVIIATPKAEEGTVGI
jgi:hypothetical protein